MNYFISKLWDQVQPTYICISKHCDIVPPVDVSRFLWLSLSFEHAIILIFG